MAEHTPLGRTANHGEERKIFSNMNAEVKVPMCQLDYDEMPKEITNLNASQKAQGVGPDGTTTGDNENESSNVQPGGRVMAGMSPSVSNEQTHSFEGARSFSGQSASGRIIKTAASYDEKVYKGSK